MSTASIAEPVYAHVIEIYALKPNDIGKLRKRFRVDARDSRIAGEIGYKSLKRHEILAVYQGTLERQGWRPVGFGGKYTIPEWEQFRDALGGVEEVIQALARSSAEQVPSRHLTVDESGRVVSRVHTSEVKHRATRRAKSRHPRF